MGHDAAAEATRPYFSTGRQTLVVALACMAQFLNQANHGQILSILHTIADTFNISNDAELSWLIAGYSLTVGTFILPAGRLGDCYGHKKLMIIGLTWYAIWNAISGTAVYSNKVLFIFSRTVAGIGSSLCLPNALALLGREVEPGLKKRLAFSMFAAVSPAGIVFGATLSGLCNLFWWPWSMFILSFILVAVIILIAIGVPNPDSHLDNDKNKKTNFRETFDKLDLGGATLGVTGLVLFNFAWNQAFVVGWQSPYLCVALVVGVALLISFVYVEVKVSSAPLIPSEALQRDTAFVLGCIACAWGAFGIWIYYIWQEFIIVREITPLLGAAWQSPVVPVGFVAALATAWIMDHLRPSWLMAISLVTCTVGMALFGTVPEDQIYWGQIFFSMIIMPWALDMSFPAATLMLSDKMHRNNQGVSASLVNTLVNYSISLALGIAGTIESQVTIGLEGREKSLKGFKAAWYFGIALSAVGLVLSLVSVAMSIGQREEKIRSADDGSEEQQTSQKTQ